MKKLIQLSYLAIISLSVMLPLSDVSAITYASKTCDWQCPSDQECAMNNNSADLFTTTYYCRAKTDAPAYKVITAGTADMPSFKNPISDMKVKIPGMVAGTPVCTGSMVDKNQVCKFPWIGNYIQGLYTYGLGIAGILATIVMMFGGVLWLTSQGNSQQVGEAKAWIGGATTGLLLLFCTFLIMNTVNPELTTLKPITVGMISKDEPEDETNFSDSDATTDIATLKNVRFNANTKMDFQSGKLANCAQQIISGLDKANIKFRVSTLITGHDRCVKGTIRPDGSCRESAHYSGRGIDIGCHPDEQSSCIQLMKYISENMTGTVWQAFFTPALQYQWRAGASFPKIIPGHGDHIHLGC